MPDESELGHAEQEALQDARAELDEQQQAFTPQRAQHQAEKEREHEKAAEQAANQPQALDPGE